MRNVLLVAIVAVASVSSLAVTACGDASSTGAIRGGIPRPGDPQNHDPNDVDLGAPDDGNPNADTAPPPVTTAGQGDSFSVTLSVTNPTVDLGAETTLDVSVAQQNGFTGNADLSVTGLPAGVTATFTPPAVAVGPAPATAKLVLKADFAAIPSAPAASAAVKVVAKAGTSQTVADANFKVNPRLTLTVPLNVDALRQAGVGTQFKNEWGAAFGTTPATLKTQANNGIVVVVRNADSAPHIVHGAGAFPHGDTARPIAPNDFEKLADNTVRQRTLTPSAATPVAVTGYPHDGADGPSASFRINIQAVP